MFLDIDSRIPPGLDFREVINETLAECDLVIVVMGQHWLDASDSKGRRRLDRTSDTHRLEVAAALDSGARVIPVLVEGASHPSEEDLPDDLKELAFLQSWSLGERNYAGDVETLAHEMLDARRQMEAKREQAAAEEAEREQVAAAEKERQDRKRAEIAAEKERERLAAEVTAATKEHAETAAKENERQERKRVAAIAQRLDGWSTAKVPVWVWIVLGVVVVGGTISIVVALSGGGIDRIDGASGPVATVLPATVVTTRAPTAEQPADVSAEQDTEDATTTVGGPEPGDLASTPYDQAVLADSPMVYWPLAAPAAVELSDAVGSHDLVPREVEGAEFVPARVDGPNGIGSLKLDGSAMQRLDSTFNPSTELGTESWTLELWMNLEQARAEAADPITLIGGWHREEPQRWYLNVRGGRLCVGIGEFGQVCELDSEVDDGEWLHVVLTYQADSGDARLFLDASEVTLEQSPWDSGEELTDAPVAIGAMLYEPSGEWREHWDGGVSRIAIYEGILEPERIQAHYRAVVAE